MKRLINQRPGRALGSFLALLPFALVILGYMAASAARLADNPDDKLLPSLMTMANRFAQLATEPSRRTGEILLWADTAASLTRLLTGVAVSMIAAIIVGTVAGLIPYLRRSLSPFIAALAMIPPLAILPILFIAFGVGELSKVMLIVFGILPFMMRDIQQRVEEIPDEQLVKAQTLGASTWQILLRVTMPQTLPRLFDATRLAMGAAWLFLIASEAIAAEQGLGYRIFLVRRYLDMQTIIPYVAWITLLAYSLDWFIRQITARLFPWYVVRRSS